MKPKDMFENIGMMIAGVTGIMTREYEKLLWAPEPFSLERKIEVILPKSKRKAMITLSVSSLNFKQGVDLTLIDPDSHLMPVSFNKPVKKRPRPIDPTL